VPHASIGGRRLEYDWIAPAHGDAPSLVLLHEGLGSVAMWRDFPQRLATATGSGVLTYSRLGYGTSDPLTAPRRVDYMHDEALVTLPALLADLGIDAPILVGHSDGASIAIIHAGAARWTVRGLILEAPHVFVEAMTIAGIEAARIAFETTDLPARIGRYHADVEAVFRGWNDIWLDPDFRTWNIEESAASIAAPTLLIQGADDPYGSLAQLDAIERRTTGPVERLVLPDCGHTPHREKPAETLAAMAAFVVRFAGA
jgi:pimeloyl-ACP methyl ester carboxylesterase